VIDHLPVDDTHIGGSVCTRPARLTEQPRNAMMTLITGHVPTDRQYTDVHSWLAPAPEEGLGGQPLRVGVTDTAIAGTCVVSVELPPIDSVIKAGEPCALIVTSPLSITPVYAPIDGLVAAVNATVRDDPGIVARDPFQAGWLIAVLPTTESSTDELFTAPEYEGLLSDAIPRNVSP
jgi:glycine cleavage system H protein